MKNKISNTVFIFSTLVVNILLIISSFVINKGAFLYHLNSYQSYVFDVFFNVITYLGDGVLILGVSGLFLLLKKYKVALWNAIIYLFSGILVQLPKHLMNAPRPRKYLEDFEQLSMPIWVNIKTQNSFPSGHTTSAFAMFVFFALALENQVLKYFFFIIACLVAISRVYLLQHFFIDVVAGAFIGSISALLIMWFLRYKKIELEVL